MGQGRGFYPQFMSIVTRGHLRRCEERGRSLRWSLRSVELVTSETIELIHRKGGKGGREVGREGGREEGRGGREGEGGERERGREGGRKGEGGGREGGSECNYMYMYMYM